MADVPENAGNVTLFLHSGSNDEIIEIPTDRGIRSLSLLPAEGIKNVSLPGITRICADGIPFSLGEGVVLENASIYGGACVSGGEIRLETSSLTISGTAAFVFGGGFAEEKGLSVVSEPSVTLTKSGLVYYEIFGGGHAWGEGSRVSSENTSVLVEGTADYVLGGGFAEDGGHSECEQTNVEISEAASVPVALFSGGSASGPGSFSSVENAKAILAGEANWAFSGDFAFGGGETRMNRSSRLEILSTGVSEIVYMGSFSSDPGSSAYVNTSELMNCGSVDQILRNSQPTDGGEAKTLIPSLFSCKSADDVQ